MRNPIAAVAWMIFVVALSVALSARPAWAAGSISPADLRCESLVNPEGIDIAAPRLSWALVPTSEGARGLKQTAYRVRVAESVAKLTQGSDALWDSGKVASSECLNIRYAGKPSVSLQNCLWQVQVWDQNGEASEWSAPATWSMGLLKSDDWKAHWIGRKVDEPQPLKSQWIWYPEQGENPRTSAPVCTRLFRRPLTLPKDRTITSASLLFTADNEATVDVNGTRVDTADDFHTLKKVDLTALLHGGENLLTATVRNTGDSPSPAGFIAQVEITFATGDPIILATDKTWKTAPAESTGWNKPGFDDTTWPAAIELGSMGTQPWGAASLNDRAIPARMLRHEFTITKPLQRAVVCYSGLGWSELYLNGKRVGNEVLSPALSDYSKRQFYVTHDVTAMLKQGDNAVGAWLGNGRFFAPRLTVPAPTRTFGAPMLRLQLHLQYTDGTTEDVLTDESWRATTDGPITANNEYDGEDYDARKETLGWASPGFNTSNWQPADLMPAPSGQMSVSMIDPTRVTGIIKPVSIKEVKPGHFIFDMGQNFAGWCQLRVEGPAGTRVTLRHAERLNEDGTLYIENLRSAKATDTYTLKGGGGAETYEPRFTFHGFQFVELTGFPGTPTLSTIEGHIVNDDLETAGTFECSNPLLNQIYRNIVWGVRSNYRSIVTDCCQRDERQGWLGDRNEESRGESYLFRNGLLYAKWVQDMADSQHPDGTISDVCPNYWEFYGNSVTWPSSLIVIPGMLMDQYADPSVLERNYPTMLRWMDQMAAFIKDDTLPHDTYGDWCMPPEDMHLIHSNDPARQTSGTLIGTTYYYHCLKLMSRYAALLHKPDDVARFEALANRLRKGLNDKFYKPAQGQYDNGTVTSSVLPLAFDMVPEDQKPQAIRHLVEEITLNNNSHVATGLIGCQWVNTVLARNGHADLGYTMATQTTYPSLGYMLAQHATTIWELWNGNTADPSMNSGNHVMLVGDLCTFLYEQIGGIRPDPARPGFSHILMQPTPVGDLIYAKATHRSPYGLISSAWKKTNKLFSWDITIPPNTTATLLIPATSADAVSESGTPATQAKGLKFIAIHDGHAEFEATSGNYHLTSH